MSEVNNGPAEYGDIAELAAQTCDRARIIIESDADCWTADWATALQPAADDDETYYRSIAHAQMNKLLELVVLKNYAHLAKRYTTQTIMDGLMLTGGLPKIEGRASRVEATYDDSDVTYIYASIDAGAVGKCHAAMVNITRDGQVRKYLVASMPGGYAYTHMGTEMIDMYIDGSALEAVPTSQTGNMATLLSAGVQPEQVDSVVAQIEAAAHDVDPAVLAEATDLLRYMYQQKREAREFEQSLGGYTDMTVQDFADMRQALDRRVQQRGY